MEQHVEVGPGTRALPQKAMEGAGTIELRVVSVQGEEPPHDGPLQLLSLGESLSDTIAEQGKPLQRQSDTPSGEDKDLPMRRAHSFNALADQDVTRTAEQAQKPRRRHERKVSWAPDLDDGTRLNPEGDFEDFLDNARKVVSKQKVKLMTAHNKARRPSLQANERFNQFYSNSGNHSHSYIPQSSQDRSLASTVSASSVFSNQSSSAPLYPSSEILIRDASGTLAAAQFTPSFSASSPRPTASAVNSNTGTAPTNTTPSGTIITMSGSGALSTNDVSDGCRVSTGNGANRNHKRANSASGPLTMTHGGKSLPSLYGPVSIAGALLTVQGGSSSSAPPSPTFSRKSNRFQVKRVDSAPSAQHQQSPQTLPPSQSPEHFATDKPDSSSLQRGKSNGSPTQMLDQVSELFGAKREEPAVSETRDDDLSSDLSLPAPNTLKPEVLQETAGCTPPPSRLARRFKVELVNEQTPFTPCPATPPLHSPHVPSMTRSPPTSLPAIRSPLAVTGRQLHSITYPIKEAAGEAEVEISPHRVPVFVFSEGPKSVSAPLPTIHGESAPFAADSNPASASESPAGSPTSDRGDGRVVRSPQARRTFKVSAVE